MAFVTKCGEFSPDGSTGDQSISGLGFDPIAVVFWWCPEVVDDDTSSAPAHFVMGAATGSANRWSQYFYVEDAINPPSTATVDDDLDPDNVLHASNSKGLADFVSFDTGGFTINWSEAGDADTKVYYKVFGGDAEVEAYADTTTISGTGDTAITGVGFLPSAGIFVSPTTLGGNNDFSVGFSDGELRQRAQVTGAVGGQIQTLGGATGAGVIMTSRGSFSLFPGGDATIYEISSYDSDGFTLSQTIYSYGATPDVFVGYIVFAGMETRVGDATFSGSSTTVFTPKFYSYSGFFMEAGGFTYGTYAAGNYVQGHLSFGGADIDLNQYSNWAACKYAILSTDGTKTRSFRSPNATIAGKDEIEDSDFDTIKLKSNITEWAGGAFYIDHSVSDESKQVAYMTFGVPIGFVPQIYRFVIFE